MLVLLRIVLTTTFVLVLHRASEESSANLNNDVTNAGWFALAVVAGFAASLTWAPLLGEMVAGPVTGLMKDGSPSTANSWLISWARHAGARGWRRTALVLAFADGVLRPHLPAAFVLGMNNARPCSRLERLFAREVWKFNHIGNCIRAHDILALRHDCRPSVHPVPEVNLALLAHLREPPPDALPVTLQPAPPPPPLQRRRSIRLFGSADRAAADVAPPP
ncbi:MAG: hypothetical protein KF791_09475 [Verrucomicrobiae bacterium]|nr:hypothetical protein [Verrucomicrobiae bacterium]